MHNTNMRSAAITGGGGGLGLEIAIALAAKGYRVFGTAMSEEEITSVNSSPAGGSLNLSVCDIADEDSVKDWEQTISSELEQGLDLLINNAGVLTPGPMEILPLSDIRKEFEVNVYGSLSVINIFLPLLRKSKGRILQIGSMSARFPIPFSGPSSASKAAMEAFVDVYRTELKPFGVDIVMVQPGNLMTGGPAKTAALLKKIADTMTGEQKELCGSGFARFTEAFNKMQTQGMAATLAAGKIIEIAEQIPAPIRVPVGQDAEEILQLVREKSDQEIDEFRLRLLGLDSQLMMKKGNR